jgi:hypothetical protein
MPGSIVFKSAAGYTDSHRGAPDKASGFCAVTIGQTQCAVTPDDRGIDAGAVLHQDLQGRSTVRREIYALDLVVNVIQDLSDWKTDLLETGFQFSENGGG